MTAHPFAPTPPRCGVCGLLARIRVGAFPDLVAELGSSYVILGDAQFYRGYCALLLKRHVTELHTLPAAEAHGWFDEILRTAAAITNVVRPIRLNYECLGNQEPHLHWHIFPRFADDRLRAAPVWIRPESERKAALEDRERRTLINALRADLAHSGPLR